MIFSFSHHIIESIIQFITKNKTQAKTVTAKKNFIIPAIIVFKVHIQGFIVHSYNQVDLGISGQYFPTGEVIFSTQLAQGMFSETVTFIDLSDDDVVVQLEEGLGSSANQTKTNQKNKEKTINNLAKIFIKI